MYKNIIEEIKDKFWLKYLFETVLIWAFSTKFETDVWEKKKTI
jgi:hypothetical protein